MYQYLLSSPSCSQTFREQSPSSNMAFDAQNSSGSDTPLKQYKKNYISEVFTAYRLYILQYYTSTYLTQ